MAVAALVGLLVIGAVVGGTVGGLAARNNNAKSSSSNGNSSSIVPSSTATATLATTTTSTTSTSSTAFPTPSNHILPLNCPAINNTQYTAESSQSFFIYCSVDLKSGSKNVQSLLRPSLHDCIDSCVDYSTNHTEGPCQGLTFGANLTR